MELNDILLDIVKHTQGLGIIENIKVIGTDESTTLAAIDADRTVIFNAKLHDSVADFEGEFGLGNLGLLNSLTKLSNYKGNGATITIERRERNGNEVPTTLIFEDTDGNKDQYRFMSKEIVDQAMKIATFRGAIWNVEIEPNSQRVSQLNEVAGIYSGIEPTFKVKTEKGQLIFEIGSAEGGAAGRRVFANNIEGEMGTTWAWNLSTFLSILKLGGTIMVRFSDQGACQIDVDSGIGLYSYIMPAIGR